MYRLICSLTGVCAHVHVAGRDRVYVLRAYVLRAYVLRVYVWRVYVLRVYVLRVYVWRVHVRRAYVLRVYVWRVYVWRVYVRRVYMRRAFMLLSVHMCMFARGCVPAVVCLRSPARSPSCKSLPFYHVALPGFGLSRARSCALQPDPPHLRHPHQRIRPRLRC